MERYCPYCMHLIQPGKPCPNCKRDPETYRPESRQLPPAPYFRSGTSWGGPWVREGSASPIWAGT